MVLSVALIIARDWSQLTLVGSRKQVAARSATAGGTLTAVARQATSVTVYAQSRTLTSRRFDRRNPRQLDGAMSVPFQSEEVRISFTGRDDSGDLVSIGVWVRPPIAS